MSSYLRPAGPSRSELIIKHSRFITSVAVTPDRAAAEAFVAAIKAEHPNANHNCWAHIAGPVDDSRNRGCSDDGEPKGTAGRPMLTVLEHSGLGDLTVVVTRYFGGIKLGTGGLVRAYSQAVREALDALTTCEVIPKTALTIKAPFEHTGLLEQLIGQHALEVKARHWEELLVIEASIPLNELDPFRLALAPYPAITCTSRS